MAALLIASCSSSELDNDNDSVEYKYAYETVEGDPMGTLIYTLDNGLKIYMSVNRDEPRITTNIAVRSGHKQDPADATGLAHYLEHMVFKGTSQIGTLNWEEENKLLQQISDLYEEHRNTTDPEERKIIYHQIDSISGLASQYAIPNEYDKMVSSMGAQGTNAYTWFEQTVYLNEIPANELERWLMLESERFSELVLRLFHTELEAVYEEFNIGQDSDGEEVWNVLFENLFKKHNYGQQTTIGTGEHLKNPSMEKIHEYFNTYYVPNNMAIVLSGDLDPDATVDLIKEYWGDFEQKSVPNYTFEEEPEITQPEIFDVYGVEAEYVDMAWRLPGASNKDIGCIEIIDMLLNNGKAGLFDLNLLQEQKVLDAYTFSLLLEDYSIFAMEGMPRDGQTLEEVRELMLAELAKIRNGEFEEWMLDAIIKDYKLYEYYNLESNWGRVDAMTDAFITGVPWNDVALKLDNLSKLTKDDIVAFANTYLQDNNYVAVNKNMGERNPYKVEKPAITKVELNRDTVSPFHANWETIETGRFEPQFIEYANEIQNDELTSGIKVSYVENQTNPIFELNYILDMGSRNDREMALAVEYLEYLGTDQYTASELQQEFFKLGVNFSVYVAAERIYISLTGLEESFEQGVELFEHILNSVVPDEDAYLSMVDGILKEREDAKLSKGSIFWSGMMNYAKYGPVNPFNSKLTAEELQAMDVTALVEKIKSITTYQHYIYYYGQKPLNDVVAVLNTNHKTPDELLAYPAQTEYPELETSENKVYFVNYDMVQSEVLMLSKIGQYSEHILSETKVFNEYFGSGLSSIVFQEIRESRALAYSAFSSYSTAGKPHRSDYVIAYVGTQVDKLGDAVGAMMELMNNMPLVEDQFDDALDAALKKIETNRTSRSSIFWSFLNAQEFGRDFDLNKVLYTQIQSMNISDLDDFFNNNIAGRNYTYCVIGRRDLVDMEVLNQLGTVEELTLEQLFGY